MKKTLTAIVTVATFTGILAGGASAATYKVQKGDTVWGIAKSEGTTVEQIQTWNKLTSDIIFPEQELVISSEPKSIKYKVISGDTLWKISRDHGVSVQDLKSWNELSSDLIHPGDSLVIEGGHEGKAQTAAASSAPVQDQPKEAKSEAGKEITVTATAYTAYCDGCSGVTATGQDLRANPEQKVIAVDPKVIPLGSKVHIDGYGTAIAGDVGGAIKGNKIDIFMPSYSDAIDYGVQTVKIKILD